MTLQVIEAADAAARLSRFSAVIDARSEAEFAEDHLPAAVNWPSLNNEERAEVGTIYKQVSPFEARKRGAALLLANISRHLEREVKDKPRDWQPLVYCWRGGKRSGVLADLLSQIGFRTAVISGGYKAFRTHVLADLPAQAQRLRYRVLCGLTGSGKTRLLHALAAEGAQVLDLEALARHRGSVLGLEPGTQQPSQKHFDMLVWEQLRGFDASRPVYVESESKKVGNVAVPESLIHAMRASACLKVELPLEARVDLLLEDYDWFRRDPDYFCGRLRALTELRGASVVKGWEDKVREGAFRDVFRELLERHYDPGYAASLARNFKGYTQAPAVAPAGHGMDAMRAVARELAAQDG